MLRAKGDDERAIGDFTQAIKFDVKNALAFYNRGMAYRGRGSIDLALADLDQAIRLDPKNPAVYYERGNALYDKRDYDRAIADLNQAINVKPDYTAAKATATAPSPISTRRCASIRSSPPP